MIMPTPPPDWSLHPQLAKDTINIGDLPLSRVLVINDANYPWLLLVPRRIGVSEIIDLDEVEQAQLWTEFARAGRALKTVTECDKLNVAALGYVVPQLHVHVIARRRGDAAWPKPVWGAGCRRSTTTIRRLERFVQALRKKMWLSLALTSARGEGLPGLVRAPECDAAGPVREAVMPGRRRELLALGNFGIGIRFEEIGNAVGERRKSMRA
jgi:diadenosine tetraphosphate (Ap4A) HIT family hydrolase